MNTNEHVNFIFTNKLKEEFKSLYDIKLEVLFEYVSMAYCYSIEPIKLPIFSNFSNSGNTMLIGMNKEMKKDLQSVYTKLQSSNKCFLNIWLFVEEDFFLKNIPNSILNPVKNQKVSFDTLKERFNDIQITIVDTAKVCLSDIEVKLINVRLKDIFMKTWCSRLMFEIVNKLIELFIPEDTYNYKSDDIYIIKKLEREIKNNYFKSQPSINSMAQYAGMSPTKFKRVFKDVFGCSPHQYILDVRANQAKELLESNHYTIAQIAYKVGFNYPSGLTRLIRTKFNVSPQEIMKKYQFNSTNS